LGRLIACVAALVTVVGMAPVPNTPGFEIVDSAGTFELTRTSGDSRLYMVSPQNTEGQEVYNDPIYFVELRGDRQTMGADYATLVGKEAEECYDGVLKKAGIGFADRKILETFMDQQWNDWLSKAVPDQYMAELEGVKSVSRSVYKVLTRVIALANLPNDLPEDMRPILIDENENKGTSGSGLKGAPDFGPVQAAMGSALAAFGKVQSLKCSMYAVWGSRTRDDQLFSCRNLDYASDTGIAPYKSVTVWNPSDGSVPHVGVGFLPVYGVLSGMNKAGITVHEANLEEKNETFRGFPWVIRLRYIMESSTNLEEAMALWDSNDNTIGYNHMIASQADAAPGSHPARVLETVAFRSEIFQDMDPREDACETGHPLPEALWRTNHPYDPDMREDYLWWGRQAYNSSLIRYMLAYESFVNYQRSDTKIDVVEAINITSVMGNKGIDHMYKCTFPYASTAGNNILSVTNVPRDGVLYSAWENGSGDNWSPAACNAYVRFDLNQYWN